MTGAESPSSVVMVVRLFAPWVGGMERQALKLGAELQRSGLADVRILTGRWFAGTATDELVDGVPVHRHPALHGEERGRRKPGAVVYMATLLWHLLRTRRSYSIIHVHGLSYHAAVCRLASLLTGAPMIVKLANSGDASDIAKMRRGQHFPGTRFVLGFALRGAAYVALNPAIRAELVDAGVDPGRIVEIPNGVEVGDLPSKQPRSDGPLRMVFVGRLHVQKDVDTVLDALVALAPSDPSTPLATLDIVGDGPDRHRLEERIRMAALGGVVTMTGETDDVASRLRNADVLVLPSRSEGISNALLEAMALGKPAIVSDIPGNTAVVRDGSDGFVFRAGDARHLAEVISRLADGPEVLAEIGRTAHDTVVREFSISTIARRYADLYRRLDPTEAP